MTWGKNLTSIDCEADALTTTLSRGLQCAAQLRILEFGALTFWRRRIKRPQLLQFVMCRCCKIFQAKAPGSGRKRNGMVQEHFSQGRSTLARSCKPIRSFKAETSFSAIAQHLLQNPTCAREYNDNKFSILARGRTSFHLSTLEVTYIKTFKPNLCKQKEFVYGLKITH